MQAVGGLIIFVWACSLSLSSSNTFSLSHTHTPFLSHTLSLFLSLSHTRTLFRISHTHGVQFVGGLVIFLWAFSTSGFLFLGMHKSPEGSYQYRIYLLAADNLPITPISCHPPADETILCSLSGGWSSSCGPSRRRGCSSWGCTRPLASACPRRSSCRGWTGPFISLC